MSGPGPGIALFARYPTPGVAKTRLIPALGEEGAAALHRKLVELTLAAVRDSGLPFEVRVTGASPAAFAAWLGDTVSLVPQGDGDLGARLARVEAPMLLIGSDCPDLTPTHLLAAARRLETSAAVIGPAGDGGYWLLGLAHALPECFQAMPWGTDTVAAETRARLAAVGITPVELDTLHDCDRPEDLARWPWLTA
ncbi:TIGR04282 family arsenosugar biosynthesis glycosyltransferase [Novosphingobium sp.]|uniref:TIGR04282 family arsenosugar biosynthesis glycosyltransferase n=1 Tax=Novosphingobium sp. TaxID=1874826 RepID=UPI0025E01EE2|nr:TIGR04282 family arsenosugar biosynthesis glycosyltransferase [Novosphingobium sp.]